MKLFSRIALVVIAGVFAASTICAPEFLGKNPFLNDFVGGEFISILVIIVTVSFVSVTQIHLEYSRVERAFNIRIFGDARREVNFGAKILLLSLFSSIILVFFKSANEHNVYAKSLLNSLALMILFICIIIMYDFIRTVYVLAAEEPIEGEGEDDED